jgi:hypothetical protein
MIGKKYGYAMATIMGDLYGKTTDEARAFMGQELQQAGEHHRPEVMAPMMQQLSMKAATAKFGEVRTSKACMKEVKQIHMRDTFIPKHWNELTTQQKAQVC